MVGVNEPGIFAVVVPGNNHRQKKKHLKMKKKKMVKHFNAKIVPSISKISPFYIYINKIAHQKSDVENV